MEEESKEEGEEHPIHDENENFLDFISFLVGVGDAGEMEG